MTDDARTHKRKRSLQGSPVDIPKMRKLTVRLEALREELAAIDETEEEMQHVMQHVNALDAILKEGKKIVRAEFIFINFPLTTSHRKSRSPTLRSMILLEYSMSMRACAMCRASR